MTTDLPATADPVSSERLARVLDDLRASAAALGFSQIGLADVDLGSAEPGLRDWLANGFHGGMAYMALHGMKRARPAELVPGTVRVITVRMLGDTAVANGTYVMHHKAGSGPVDEKGVFTHVFERQRGGWVCVNSQRTSLREDAPGKGKKKQTSSAELPFHLPLFSKGDKKD